ncbi:MAG: cyclic nucleotide-binding domain-containing protein [Gammaproteobacteria bacterium]|nr:cyclic nucleotide-binding domain-containing protein [Gammaproteobacteria bacterium]
MSTLVDRAVLEKLTPLSGLSPDSLQELSAKIQIETIAGGRFVLRKGDTEKQHIYLINGTADLTDDKAVIKTIASNSPEAIQPLTHHLPRTLSVRAKGDCQIIRIDSNLLDLMLTWSQTGTYHVEEISSGEDNDDDWMTQLLQTKAFHRIPPANIQAIFMRMQSIAYNPGDAVITQGEEGDYFYIIKSGRALVTRATPGNPKGTKLAELGPGDSFGEEALISEAQRNASITMLTRGSLMRLSKEDFMSLLNEPMLNWLTYNDAKTKIAAGNAEFLDIRLPPEFKAAHIKGALNMPMMIMRIKIKTLDPKKQYILYCDTGRRSSAAVYILNENGFDAFVLKDGLSSVSESDQETG